MINLAFWMYLTFLIRIKFHSQGYYVDGNEAKDDCNCTLCDQCCKKCPTLPVIECGQCEVKANKYTTKLEVPAACPQPKVSYMEQLIEQGT